MAVRDVFMYLPPDAAELVCAGSGEAFSPVSRPSLRVWLDLLIDQELSDRSSDAVGLRLRSIFAWSGPVPGIQIPAYASIAVRARIEDSLTRVADPSTLDPLLASQGPALIKTRMLDLGHSQNELEEEFTFFTDSVSGIFLSRTDDLLQDTQSGLLQSLVEATRPEVQSYVDSLQGAGRLSDRELAGFEFIVPVEALVHAERIAS